MEESFEFLSVANIVLFSAALKSGLLVRYGEIKQSKPLVVFAHWLITALAILSLIIHFAVHDQRPWYLIVSAGLIVLIPLAAMIPRKTRFRNPESPQNGQAL